MSRRGLRRGLSVALAVGLGGCGNTGLSGASGQPVVPPTVVDGWQQIPLADLDSRPVTLAQLLAGRPALVNLWAPWCERCKTELPDLDRLARQLDGCGLVVGVAVGEDAPHTAAFVHERGLGYPQVVDEEFHLADALRQTRVPTTLVIDGAGAIVYVGPALDQAAVGALKGALSRAGADGHCTNHEPSWARPRDFVATTRLKH
jgi:cytochrome c biogenesis protein CcmG/thiol:disulfide interchange protein DsbE